MYVHGTLQPLELLFYDWCFSLFATADGAVYRAQEVDQSGGWLESLQRETEEVCKMRVQLVVISYFQDILLSYASQ